MLLQLHISITDEDHFDPMVGFRFWATNCKM